MWQGFEEAALSREPVLVGTSEGFKVHEAGPVLEMHARRGRRQVSIYDWPADDGVEAMVAEAQCVLDQES